MGTRIFRTPAPHRPARLVTGLYALATVVALALTLFARSRPHPTLGEEVFGLLNVPVAATFVSVVVLALATRALWGRKRIGLWFVAVFQALGIYLGIAELLPGAQLPLSEMWETRGDLGRGLDTVSMVVAVVALWWLWRIRGEFTGRLQRGSWGLAAAALAVGSAVTLVVAWLLVGAVNAPRSQVRELVGTVLAAFGGIGRRNLVRIPPWVVDVVAACAALTILAAVTLFLASARPRSRWSQDREVALRGLLARHGSEDSLGYFATRRDKASVFSPDGRAAVTYRVIAGVSLASADPVGHRDSWQPAIEAWRAEAREFGWVPAVVGASERGARAYAAPGACACCSSGTRRSSTPRATTCDGHRCHRCGTPSGAPPVPGSRCRSAASASCGPTSSPSSPTAPRPGAGERPTAASPWPWADRATARTTRSCT